MRRSRGLGDVYKRQPQASVMAIAVRNARHFIAQEKPHA
jgi:hypothetical protein